VDVQEEDLHPDLTASIAEMLAALALMAASKASGPSSMPPVL
jgi:hypothetical protein